MLMDDDKVEIAGLYWGGSRPEFLVLRGAESTLTCKVDSSFCPFADST